MWRWADFEEGIPKIVFDARRKIGGKNENPASMNNFPKPKMTAATTTTTRTVIQSVGSFVEIVVLCVVTNTQYLEVGIPRWTLGGGRINLVLMHTFRNDFYLLLLNVFIMKHKCDWIRERMKQTNKFSLFSGVSRDIFCPLVLRYSRKDYFRDGPAESWGRCLPLPRLFESRNTLYSFTVFFYRIAFSDTIFSNRRRNISYEAPLH